MITQEMNDLRWSVSSQIERATNEAISEEIILKVKLLLGPGNDKYQIGDGRSLAEDRNVDLKKP